MDNQSRQRRLTFYGHAIEALKKLKWSRYYACDPALGIAALLK